MIVNNDSALSLKKPTLSLTGTRAFVFQLIFIAAAVILPMVSHLSGISVRMFLPMHWPVLLAGLVYGWRGGLVTGMLAPTVNYFISGYPLPLILPSMTVELMTYGFTAGFLREELRFKPYSAMIIAIIAGRIVFAASVVLGNVIATNQMAYFQAALLPGITAAILQIILLPLCAQWWITQEKKSQKK